MTPFRFLFLLFILVPLVEIYLLIQVGSVIGGLPTVLLIILTAIVGVGLLKQQGLSTLMTAQQSLARGELPALQLLEGAALLVSGALLLTPGFVTDFIGFIGLIPLTRQALLSSFLSRRNAGASHPFHTTERDRGVTIDGEFQEKQEPPDPWLK